VKVLIIMLTWVRPEKPICQEKNQIVNAKSGKPDATFTSLYQSVFMFGSWFGLIAARNNFGFRNIAFCVLSLYGFNKAYLNSKARK
jgi:hypothetical protein